MIIKRIIPYVTLLYIALITFLSLMPFSGAPSVEMPYFDKFVHVCFYLGLNGLLLLWTVNRRNRRLNISSTLIITLISILYSITMELLQSLTGRSCDIEDVVANSIGAIIGCILFYLFRLNSPKKN